MNQFTSNACTAMGSDGPTIGPYERVLWADGDSVLGRFDADPDAPDFSDAGPIGAQPAIAFPQSAVRIEPEGEEGFISDPTIAVLHNPCRPYTRRDIFGVGDHCEWISIRRDALGNFGPWLDERHDMPFSRSSAPIAPRAYALMRLLVRYLRQADEPDRALVHQLLSDVLQSVALGLRHSPTESRTEEAHERHTALVEEVKNLLLRRFSESWMVESIAESVGSSPFHLSRVFRRRTGYTLHRYLTELRLRHSLGRLEDDGVDLTDIALDVGFCSHSHFTVSFSATFGVPPSEFRKQPDERQLLQFRRLVG